MRKVLVWSAGVALAAIAVAALTWHLSATSVDQLAENPERAKLGSDLEQYRKDLPSLDGPGAARRWFALYDQALELDEDSPDGDLEGLDFHTGQPVGWRSLLSALPPPAAWPALRAEADRRAQRNPKDTKTLGLQFLARLLDADRAGAAESLNSLERAGVDRSQVYATRSVVARIYGNGEQRVAALQAQLEQVRGARWVDVPGLVALVGETKARTILEQAVKSATSIHIQGDPATRALARQVALENIEHLRVPQWNLAADFDGARLYEALMNRFKSKADIEDEHFASATHYYFLRMVSDGRQAEAERALKILNDQGELSIPHAIVEALERANLREELYRFLHAQLDRRPELRAWDLYVEQAAYTGHALAAIALIEKQLARKDLAAELRRDLGYRHAAAFLAVDDVARAEKEYLALFAQPPNKSEPELAARVNAVLDAAAAGRLTGRRALQETAMEFAGAALALPRDESSAYEFLVAERNFSAELRKQGRTAEALQIRLKRIAALERADKVQQAEFSMLHFGSRDGLVELAALQMEAGKPGEVIMLLRDSKAWSAEDLAELLDEKDSAGVPMGAIAARALRDTGDREAALRVAKATVAAVPGHDAAYEIVVAFDPVAAAFLDERFGLDEFEERPLIWKAQLQLNADNLAVAEATIRRAIAIDPSDGEEGPNDRMRAYAILAEILKRRGDVGQSALYAGAVQAIRMSEHADEYHRAGLYERAFTGYRGALEKFSDAYCIQSRLAVQLNKRGKRDEAMVHYRRAYELMPSSFGRVESHCFGCENVFQGEEAQGMAERVFSDIIRRSPRNAQAHYLLAYLREQQGRYDQAVQPLRAAVSIDDRYLNAWKRLQDLADETFIEPDELDIARLKLLELDPMKRHSYYSLEEVGQLAALWNGVNRAHDIAVDAAPPASGVYPLAAVARERNAQFADVPAEFRERFEAVRYMRAYTAAGMDAAFTLGEHVLVKEAQGLMAFPGSTSRF
jgi:tetratricopeptide (TPR) repeat protein